MNELRQYSRAVDELPTPEERRGTAGKSPEYGLAGHLGIYLWHDRLEPTQDGLFGKSVDRAVPDELAHLVPFFGRTMDSLDETESSSELEPVFANS